LAIVVLWRTGRHDRIDVISSRALTNHGVIRRGCGHATERAPPPNRRAARDLEIWEQGKASGVAVLPY
jgi:hypothetical protein